MVAVHTTVIYNSFLHYSSLTTVNPKQYKNHTFKNMTNNNKKKIKPSMGTAVGAKTSIQKFINCNCKEQHRFTQCIAPKHSHKTLFYRM